MSKAAVATFVLLSTLTPLRVWAGEVACVYERGVVVVPASIAGMAGDYILDTGSLTTQLHETKAQMAGLTETTVRTRVQVAGLSLADRPVLVVDLDARTAPFPTPIAGVIGADLLAPYVVDVRFTPCRVSIRRPRYAGRFPAKTILPMLTATGPASVRVAVADGPHADLGAMTLSTGSDAAVRVSVGVAGAVGASDPLLPYSEHRAILRALSLGGELFENVEAGLLEARDDSDLGVIGAPILAHWRVRFNFPARRVLLAAP